MLLVDGAARTATGTISDITTIASRCTALEARADDLENSLEVIPFPMSFIQTGTVDKITDFPLGPTFVDGSVSGGVIESAWAEQTTTLVGSGGAADISLLIDDVAVTGGVVSPAIGTPTVGAKIAGTAVTANSAFGPTSKLRVRWTTGTAFTAGAGTLYVRVRRSNY